MACRSCAMQVGQLLPRDSRHDLGFNKCVYHLTEHLCGYPTVAQKGQHEYKKLQHECKSHNGRFALTQVTPWTEVTQLSGPGGRIDEETHPTGQCLNQQFIIPLVLELVTGKATEVQWTQSYVNVTSKRLHVLCGIVHHHIIDSH